MKTAGFGCTDCGLLLALVGFGAIAAAFVPGVINGSEQGTAMAVGGGLCATAFLPFLVGEPGPTGLKRRLPWAKADDTCVVDRQLITGASPDAANNLGVLAANTLLEHLAQPGSAG